MNIKNLSTEWSMDRSVKGYLSKNSALKISGREVKLTTTVMIEYLSRTNPISFYYKAQSHFNPCDYDP